MAETSSTVHVGTWRALLFCRLPILRFKRLPSDRLQAHLDPEFVPFTTRIGKLISELFGQCRQVAVECRLDQIAPRVHQRDGKPVRKAAGDGADRCEREKKCALPIDQTVKSEAGVR